MSFREFYSLYDLERNDEWNFTNDPAGYSVASTKFEPKTISRSAIQQTGTTSKSKLNVTFPADDEFYQTIKRRMGDSRITMEIWRQIFDRVEDDLIVLNDTVILLAFNISIRSLWVSGTPFENLLDSIKAEFVNIARHLNTIAIVRGIRINLGIAYYYYQADPAVDPSPSSYGYVNIVLAGSTDLVTELAAIDAFFSGIPTPALPPLPPEISSSLSVSYTHLTLPTIYSV